MAGLGPRKQKTPQQVEKIRKAIELRKAGATYEQIAKQIGLKSKGQCYEMIRDALHDMIQEPAAELRILELERLDALMLAHWPQKANPRNAEILLKLMDRRAKLIGLDAPTKTEVSVDMRSLSDEELERIANGTASGSGVGTPTPSAQPVETDRPAAAVPHD